MLTKYQHTINMADDSSTMPPSSTTSKLPGPMRPFSLTLLKASPENTDCGSTVAETVGEGQQTVVSPPSSTTGSDVTVQPLQPTLSAVPPVFAPTTVPVNTRAPASDAGEGQSQSSSSSSDHLSGLMSAFDLQMATMAKQTPLPPSEPDTNEGRAHLRGPLRSELSLYKQLFKAPPPRPAKRKKPKQALIRDAGELAVSPTTLHQYDTPPTTEHVHEQNTWVTVALEDIDRGLKRLVMAAKDQKLIDNSKTAAQHYSGYLARAIKAQELQLDPEELK